MKHKLITIALFAVFANSLFALPKTSNSLITNSNAKSVSANKSSIDTGIKLESVKNSNISTNVNAGNISANNANLNIGNVSVESVNNSNIKTSVSAGNISANNANLNIGNVNAKNIKNSDIKTNINLGNVSKQRGSFNYGSVKSSGGKEPSKYQSKFNNETNIGTVTVDDNVKNVDIETNFGGNATNKFIAKRKAKMYEDNDGVDKRGVKHVYVDKKEFKDADRNNKSVGNTNLTKEKGRNKIKKVSTFVDTGKRKNNSSDDDEEEEW